MKKYTEEEIIHHLQSDLGSTEREQGAAMLLEQYAGLLWSVCARRLQNTEDIKECVNSTFAQVCLHPEKYDAQKGSLKNYLCMVADRKAIDHYHENVRRQQAEEKFARETEMGSMAVADGFPSGNDRAADKLEEALAQLAPIDSQILRMKYYD
ncbi:MAG: sigma-70 family RNA polymerase sigma factor, partial [Lachnospiraceae bacterium]|nr:sigma-70 family RNA polymerase sigma factor [Lachnospiraceae bacterium]